MKTQYEKRGEESARAKQDAMVAENALEEARQATAAANQVQHPVHFGCLLTPCP